MEESKKKKKKHYTGSPIKEVSATQKFVVHAVLVNLSR